MERVKIKSQGAKKICQGYPVISKKNILAPYHQDTEIKEFVDAQGQFLGLGYLCDQHKAAGFVLSREKRPINRDFFINLFQIARKKRSYYFQHEEETSAFRLFNAEGDGLGGLTIDKYGVYAVFSFYNEWIYAWRNIILEAFMLVYEDEIQGAYYKLRFQTDQAPSAHFYGEEAPEPYLIRENGIYYPVYLNEGWMTGIFLDQHEVRGRLVEGQACGLNVLNTFSYTGAFSLAAAMGGAAKTVSVDLASRSLEKTREVFAVNGIDPSTQEIRVMDVFDYCHWAQKKGLSFDMIILDPPSFARNGKKTFSVAKDYGKLVEAVLPLLNPEAGILIASTNAANVSVEQYKKMIHQAIQTQGWIGKQRSFDRLPHDFVTTKAYPEGNYLKVLTYDLHKN